jgi:hypothetical protein
MESDEPSERPVSVRGRPDYFVIGNGLVDGVHVTISVPYTGLYNLWQMRPNALWTMSTYAELSQNEDGDSGWVRFDLEQPVGDSPEKLRSQLEQHLHPIRETLKAQSSAIGVAMSKIESHIRAAVAGRRKSLSVHAAVKEALKIPIRRRLTSPSPFPVTLTKRVAKPVANGDR